MFFWTLILAIFGRLAEWERTKEKKIPQTYSYTVRNAPRKGSDLCSSLKELRQLMTYMPIMTVGSSSLSSTLYSRFQWFTVMFFFQAVVYYLICFPKSHLRIKAQTQRASNFSYLFAIKHFHSRTNASFPTRAGRAQKKKKGMNSATTAAAYVLRSLCLNAV